MREVLRMTGLSRSTLYRRIADGTFPAPVSLGGSAKGWRRSDLEEWEQDPAGFKLIESCTTMTSSQGAKVRQVKYRSEEHTSELQSLMRTSYAVFCFKNKNTT